MSGGNGAGPVRAFEPIAIVGMRGRFPGAPDLETYWRNLADGVESIAVLSPAEMRAAGVPDHISRLPGYVNASPVLDGVDEFDAEFFGFSARDASLTDPQHRLFLETCWEALEDAGYDPATYAGAIGVFGGCELSTYLYQLYQNHEALKYVDGMQLMVTNDKDHLCTQVSYRLDLRGPSVAVQTTCSTSLVAVALACESLQGGRSDMALAGGVTVRVPQRGGYFYTAGSILSPDGHCRPFDANAQGTIVGSGVGVVVLKRLADALADRDDVRAVILGVGINNDGNDKVGYTAPSFRGQAAAIRAAHAAAGVSPESIGYVEAHGTGTILGDPIEVAALNEAFKAGTSRRGFCGIGSVKSNFGHLSCAAGVAGLIKTVLVLEHGAIPPTVHYQSPNPAIDFVASPFYVTTRLQPWARNGTPRRAGVSSFGVGGTNAHVVIEEAPAREQPAERRSHQLVVLSARSPAALDAASSRLAAHLRAHPELDLADVAFTLHVGRRAFPHRRALVARGDDASGLAAALAEPDRVPAALAGQGHAGRLHVPGPGLAVPRHGRGPLRERAGGAARDRPLRRRPQARTGRRPAKAAVPVETHARGGRREAARHALGPARAVHRRLRARRALGVVGRPAGRHDRTQRRRVRRRDARRRDGARRRAAPDRAPGTPHLRSAARVDAGGHGPRGRARALRREDVSLAAVNAPGYWVLSGPEAAIDSLESALEAASLPARRLHTSHAFHSAMMDPILAEFEDVVAGVRLSPPTIPFASTLSGGWTDGDVTQPRYWSAQLRSPVRFADGLATLADAGGRAGKDLALLEVGPGNTLATFAAETAPGLPRLTSLPGPRESRTDTEVILDSLGRLWTRGAPVDWDGFHRTERRARVSLPTYPFERRVYWVGPRPAASAEAPRHEPRDTSGWFHRPAWREAPAVAQDAAALAGRRILVFDEEHGLGAAVSGRIRAAGGVPVVVRQGSGFARASATEYVLDPANADGFRRLAAAVCAAEDRLAGVVDCWSAAPPGDTDLDQAGVVTLLSPMRLAHALSSQPTVRPLPVLLVARGSRRVQDGDPLDPPRALGVGSAKVLPQEHPGLRVAHVDVDGQDGVAELLLGELASGAPEPAVALRGGRRFVEVYEPLPIASVEPPRDLPERPVVFVTGGLGHMGLSLSEGLFERLGARLVLVGRTTVPAPEEWASASEDPSATPELRDVLRRLARLRAVRDDVLVLKADANDARAVRGAVDKAIERFGRVDLVVHGAARIDTAAFASAADTGPDVVDAQFSPKLRGVYALVEAFRGREPRRWVLHSSISSVLGGLGLAAYSGANAVLDALAVAGGPSWLSVDWDLWDNAAEAHAAGMPVPIHPPEGLDSLLRLLGADVGPRVLVAVKDLAGRLDAWVRHGEAGSARKGGVDRHPRPSLSTAYVEPRTDTERELVDIWGAQLAIESVGIHDRFFDLGGHSLLAVQVAPEVRDRFQIELPVLKLFQAPTVAELAVLVERARAAGPKDDAPAGLPAAPAVTATRAAPLEGEAPAAAAKASYREFYDDVTRQLERSGVGEVSFFLNYGYITFGDGDEALFEVPAGVFNPSSVRLAFELLGGSDLRGRRVLDVGCGRGGTVALLADRFESDATGVDLSPEAIAFCRRTHSHPRARFEVGDAEHLPFERAAFDAVTNIESSHTYPNLRAFYAEVARVLSPGGVFLYTDLLPVTRWMEVRALLAPLGLRIQDERDITRNVLASCDEVAATRAQAFGGSSTAIDNFLAVPGSVVYEQMQSGAWEYRIVRALRA